MNEEAIRKLVAERVLHDLQISDDDDNKTEKLSIVEASTSNQMLHIWDEVNKKAYLPYLDTQEVNMVQLYEFQMKLLEENANCSCILAVTDTTGTILYYEMTPGFEDDP